MDFQHQRYSLKWNEFQLHISRAFGSLREQEAFTDITLGCDGKILKAHRVILCASSPYFRQLLEGHDALHPIVFLKDVNHRDMEAILDFIYTGAVDLDQEQLQSFLSTAEALQVKGLTKGENFRDVSEKPPQVPTPQIEETPPTPREQPVLKRSTHESSSSEEDEHFQTEAFTQGIDQNQNNIPSTEDSPSEIDEKSFQGHPALMSYGMDSDGFHFDSNVPLKKRAKTVSVPAPGESMEVQIAQLRSPKGSCSEFMYNQRIIKGSRAGVSKYGLSPDLKCSQCDKVFVHAASLIKHRSFHEGNTVCPFCSRVYSHKYTLREHVIREHGDRVHEVPSIAFKKTPSRNSLKEPVDKVQQVACQMPERKQELSVMKSEVAV